jgi:hypothetical protein
MKKKVMSEEALKLVLTSEPVVEPVAIEPVVEPVVEPVEPVVEPVEPEATEDDTKLAELVQAEFDDYKVTTDATIAEFKAEAENQVGEVEALTAEHATQLEGLKEIVVGQIAQMRIGLSLAAVDMKEWTVAQVLVEYEAVKEPFIAKLPVGSLIPESTDTKGENPVVSSLDASNLTALGF